MCMMGGGGGAAAAAEDKPFTFSKFKLSTWGDGEKWDPFGLQIQEEQKEAAAVPINLNEDLGIVDPLSDVEDGNRDKNKLNVNEDDSVKKDKFKRRQTKQQYKKPKSGGFMNVVT